MSFSRAESSNGYPGYSTAGYLVLLGFSLLWCLGILTFPLATMLGWGHEAGLTSRILYSPVCHQELARSFSIYGTPLSVCHRCSSIYFAFAGAVILWPFFCRRFSLRTFSLRHLVVAILPLILDAGLGLIGIRDNTVFTRTITGLAAGLGLAMFFIPAWMDLWRSLRTRTNSINLSGV